jgi:uncharacterized protein (TIGR00369 family)
MSSYDYGVLNPVDCRGMSGKEILQSIIDGRLPQAPISKILSFWIAEVGDGVAVFEGDSGPDLLNPMGTVHGGWALTLIDSAAGCAAHSLLPAGSSYSTVETKVNFSKPITQLMGRVRAEARVVSQGRQIISASAQVIASDGRILAHGTSTVIVGQHHRGSFCITNGAKLSEI